MSSSRLIVKNLPKHMNEKRFKEHFEKIGIVTDVKIIRGDDGQSRKFGFVGFKSEKHAKAAQEYFNGTFIDTSKIDVNFAFAIGDGNLPRAWSRHSKGSSAYDRINEGPSKSGSATEPRISHSDRSLGNNDKNSKNKNDPNYIQFLMQNKNNNRSKMPWQNDFGVEESRDIVKGVTAEIRQVEAKKTGGAGVFLKKMHVHYGSESDENCQGSSDDNSDDGCLDDNNISEAPLAFNNNLSDMEYLKSKSSKFDCDSDDESSSDEDNVDVKNSTTSKSLLGDGDSCDDEKRHCSESVSAISAGNVPVSTSLSTRKQDFSRFDYASFNPSEAVGESGRLFVRNLAYSTTEQELTSLFKKHGPLAEVHIPIDKETKKTKGMAYILYMFPDHAAKAMAALDGTIFHGRLLHILPSRSEMFNGNVDENGDKKSRPGSSSYKLEQEKKKKADAGSSHNWNPLFMRGDAVADSLAARYQVDKGDIFSPEGTNAAVKMALGETQIINETSKYFALQGISLSLLGPSVKTTIDPPVSTVAVSEVTSDDEDEQLEELQRSSTMILVKNIPYSTEEQDLRELFSKYGGIDRILLPPAGTIAIVEFFEPSEARKAFRSLAYRNFKQVPLYLEWVPLQACHGRNKMATISSMESGSNDNPSMKLHNSHNEEDDILETSTIYIKNLNFSTTEDTLRKTFQSLGGYRSIVIAKRKNGDASQSMGYGFVEYETKADALEALKKYQGVKVDDHDLQLKLSSRNAGGTKLGVVAVGRPKTHVKSNTKLIVRNVPFEATKKELQELFSTFGQLKSVRIPRKFDGTHRGFAFVDFLTKNEAKNAMEALGNIHLYGRHLVLEYAQGDQNLEAIREKTAKRYTAAVANDDRAKKRARLDMNDEDADDKSSD